MSTSRQNINTYTVSESLDHVDKALSRSVFQLELGKLEYVLAFPGSWHGVPVIAMGCPLPQVMVLTLTGSWEIAAILFFISVLFAFDYVRQISEGSITKFYSVKLLIPYMFGSLYLVNTYTDPNSNALAGQIFYLCGYFGTQAIIFCGKVFMRRLRPGSCLEKELSLIHRELPALNYLNRQGHVCFESFPSGDAAGAMVFSAALFIITDYQYYWVFLFGFMSAFGRMYFFAHHLFDVLVGEIVAFTVLFTFDHLYDWKTFGTQHMFYGFPAFLAWFFVLNSLKPQVPEEYTNVGEKNSSPY